MKHSLLVPPVFILVFLATFISLTAVHTVISYGSHFSDTGESSAAYILKKIPHSMAITLPASVLLAILMMLFRLVRSMANKLFLHVFLLATAFFVLAGGMYILVPVLAPEREGPRLYRDYIEEKKFNKVENLVIYPWKVTSDSINRSLVVDSGREDWKLYASRYAGLTVSPSGLVVAIDGFAPRRIPSEAGTRFDRLLSSNPVTSELFRAFSIVAADLRRLAAAGAPGFLLLCFAFVFFYSSLGVLLKITRWPLFNLAIMLFFASGALYLYGFYQTQVVPALGSTIRLNFLSAGTPTLVMIIFGLLFFLVDLLFIPSQFWRREIEGV